VKRLKIKINNIFKNRYFNEETINLKRRGNLKNIEQNNNEHNKEENIEYKRKGAIQKHNIFNVLKIFKSKFAIKRSYYILFVLMVILATASIYTNISTYRVVNNESYTVFSNTGEVNENQKVESSITEDLQDLNSNNIDTRNDSKSQNPTTSINKNVVATIITPSNTNKATSTKNIIEPLVFVKPINGEVIKGYSVDKLLYSKTLESWKTHDGIDIKAELNENVRSIEKGIVEKIYDDSFLGTTIIIDHGQGYKSIYSNLDTSVNVKEKQIIKKSAIVGKVGETAIGEIKDGPHIHFMIMLNNKVIDPSSKIKF